MRSYGLGIIGYGGFGRFLHNSFREIENMAVVALADHVRARDPGTGIRFYTDWHELLSDSGVDIVSIVTPPSTHEEIACAAMTLGKHVLIEKPLATTVEAARNIIAVRDRTGASAAVNYMMRYNPIIEALQDIGRKKIFGELRRADVENYAQDSGLPAEHWFWDRSMSGGILIEHAVHFIDVVHSLTDQKPAQVAGLVHSRNARQQDQVLASALYDRGLIATHYHSFAYPGFFESTSIRLAFDLAVIDIEGWIPLKGSLRALVNSVTEDDLRNLPGFVPLQSTNITEVDDESRPEGWGEVQGSAGARPGVRSHGVQYDAHTLVRGTFEIAESKAKVYKECVCRVLTDLVRKIENPEYAHRTALENGLTSLEVACGAAKTIVTEVRI